MMMVVVVNEIAGVMTILDGYGEMVIK